MEYVFSTKETGAETVEVLKTVGYCHSCLTGRQVVERSYTDRVIEDQFTIVRCYKSKVGSDGKYYDWYEIKDHFRDTDRFLPQKSDIQAQIDYLAMMTDVELDTEV